MGVKGGNDIMKKNRFLSILFIFFWDELENFVNYFCRFVNVFNCYNKGGKLFGFF